MQTGFRLTRDRERGGLHCVFEVSDHDMERLELDHIERQIVNSPASDAADIALCLEIVFRRMKEQGIFPLPAAPENE